MLQITITEIDQGSDKDVKDIDDELSNELVMNSIDKALEIVDDMLREGNFPSDSKIEQRLSEVTRLLFSAQMCLYDREEEHHYDKLSC